MENNIQSKISVLIPTYNYAHFLDETIQSVLDQTFRDFELIIVDNHSTDNTEAVVGKYLKDPRVAYHKNEKNIGLVPNWNLCLTLARNEYVKIICADDKIHPDMLQKYYEIMESNPNVSLTTCDKQLFDGQPWLVELPLRGLQNGRKVIFHTMTSKSWIGEPTSVMFRKSNLGLGPFRTDLTLHVDWEFWIRHLSVGDCYIVPEVLAYIRAHASQHTRAVINHAAFEEYRMANFLYDLKGFDNAADKATIRTIVKEKAAQCAKKAMYKEIPHMLNKNHRDVFVTALGITAKEGVFIKGLSLLWKGFKAKSKTNMSKSLTTVLFLVATAILMFAENNVVNFIL